MRTKLVAGNWKMNFTCAEAVAAVESFARIVAIKETTDIVVCPPYLSIGRVRELLRNTHIKLGAQDVFWKDWGAYTGQISPPMLYDCGVTYCIVGHSETRGRFGATEVEEADLGYFAETDRTVNHKIRALLYHSINPILCVGETQAEREAGRTDEVVTSQLEQGLAGIDPSELYFLVVAYEPVWAIGTGNTCSVEEAERVCSSIRGWFARKMDEDLAEQVRILYGGSVKASNSDELFNQPNIDGGLVGGASLDPGEFSRIVMSA
ncbi:MAG TPA: triose-phosphate isomerase [Fimbriimonadaceae bacterium]|nr:triose-phosphate isomerase [Fimbriimonadaceae bacterium]